SFKKGLSRVWGNSYARFLGGWGGSNVPRLPDQTLETKARFIQQMRSGDVTIREIDDISEVVLSAAEIKAIASGNPKIIRKVQLDAELVKLDSLQSGHRDTLVRMRSKLQGMAW